jgi:hypothetical protein
MINIIIRIRDTGCYTQGVTYERFASFQGMWQARTEVDWTIQDFGEVR